MPTFLFLTDTCLNLENVTHVKLGEGAKSQPFCEVFFAGSIKPQRFEGADHAKIVEFMKKNKAG